MVKLKEEGALVHYLVVRVPDLVVWRAVYNMTHIEQVDHFARLKDLLLSSVFLW
jgi:hypothetical protein